MDKIVIRDELLRLRARHGHLTPEVAVDEARAHNSPLHGEFEWADSVAGHAPRLEPARWLF